LVEVCKRNGEATFAGMGGKEEDAPITAIGPASIELVKPDPEPTFMAAPVEGWVG
jgi:hypothetical protein